MKKYIRSLLVICLCIISVFSLNGCSGERMTVSYTIYPVQYLLERIAGNYISTQSVSDGTKPIQVANIVSNYKDVLERSNVIMRIGDLEPYWNIYEKDIKEADTEIVDLSGLAAIYDFKRYTFGEISGNKVVVESNWYDGDLFNLTDTYEKDMGLWLDPIAMTSMGRTIRDYMVAKDPTNTAFYNNNFKALEADLVRLDSEYSALSDDNIKLVTLTPSFGTWQKNYNIAIYPLILSKFGALPTNEQLEVIEKRIRDDEVKYIVKESNMTEEMNALFEKVKADCALTEVSLSNLSSLTSSEYEQNKNYLSIMYENLTNIEQLIDSNNDTQETTEETTDAQ